MTLMKGTAEARPSAPAQHTNHTNHTNEENPNRSKTGSSNQEKHSSLELSLPSGLDTVCLFMDINRNRGQFPTALPACPERQPSAY